jgi:hypothetical protein
LIGCKYFSGFMDEEFEEIDEITLSFSDPALHFRKEAA